MTRLRGVRSVQKPHDESGRSLRAVAQPPAGRFVASLLCNPKMIIFQFDFS